MDESVFLRGNWYRDIESNGHLSLIADSEIMGISSRVICEEIGDHWLVIQESRLNGQTPRYDQKSVEIGVKPQTNTLWVPSFNVGESDY